MGQPVTPERMFQETDRQGVFMALIDFVNKGDMDKEQASDMLVKAFNVYKNNVKEAQDEIRKIDVVLRQISGVVDRGMRKQPWVDRDPRVVELAHQITLLDGWVISLYETLLTMVAFGRPDRGKAKARELGEAFEKQWAIKIKEMNLAAKDHSLFKLG